MFDLIVTNGRVVDGTGAPPQFADVAIENGTIVGVGTIRGPARRVIDADGLALTPGFVDIHTHYDGQATWDSQLDPSFSAGVTTAIMGNCGVGFAPVRSEDHERLIELMEGVEEIPGTALHAGLQWNWNSFPEYLEVLDIARTLDIGALLPHGPLRRFVMGDKVGSDKCASNDELKNMTRLVEEAMAAGAFGLSSSRTSVHRTALGKMTDDFNVDEPELSALIQSVAKRGGYFEVTPYGVAGEDEAGLRSEMRMYDRIMQRTGATMHITLSAVDAYPQFCWQQLAWMNQVNAAGTGKAYAQVGPKSVSILLGFYGINPFMSRPTMIKVKEDYPRERWLQCLARPEIKANILAEKDVEGGFGAFIGASLHRCYDLGPEVDYEPEPSRSITRMAAAEGRETSELLYDLMASTSERPRLMMAFNNYIDENYDDVRRMLLDPAALSSLSDAGAHVQSISDGSLPIFMLTHWVRDRKRGERLPLETVVRMLTGSAARSIGLRDRGLIAPGYKADLNVIDLSALKLHPPRFVADLPAGATRLLQAVTGFRATIVSGIVTRENDEPTGTLPGRLIRHNASRRPSN